MTDFRSFAKCTQGTYQCLIMIFEKNKRKSLGWVVLYLNWKNPCPLTHTRALKSTDKMSTDFMTGSIGTTKSQDAIS